MRKAGILAIALMLIAATVGTAAGSAWGKVYYETPYGKVVFKPKRVEFSDLTLSKLKWRHWGSKVARAHGRSRVNDCIPYCAAGTIHFGTTSVHIYRRKTVKGKLAYTCIKGSAKADGQKYPIQLCGS